MFKIDDFDYATYSSLLLGLGDILWLAHDISTRGMNLSYVIIGTIFMLGNIGLAVGLKKHHKIVKKVKKCHNKDLTSQ